MKIPAVDRRILRYAVRAAVGARPVPLSEVRFVFLPAGTHPGWDSPWSTTPVIPGEDGEDDEAWITVAGPDAEPGEGLVLARGLWRLYLQAVDNPEIITEAVDSVTIG